MKNTLYLKSVTTGKALSGYTVKLYKWKDTNPYYDENELIGTFTDHGDGTYSIDVTSTVKGTVVVISPESGESTVLQNFIGHLFSGDDTVELSKKEVDTSSTEEEFKVE